MKLPFLQKIHELKYIKRAISLVWESARRWTVMSMVMMIFQALLPLGILYLIKLTVDAISFGITSPDKVSAWQKIALSRAFLRDAQLIILDEPTSAMSVRAEYEIFQSFKKLLQGRSALLISHRFSTVKMADKICVLENGSILEQGKHEELIKSGGRYCELYEMQACNYR